MPTPEAARVTQPAANITSIAQVENDTAYYDTYEAAPLESVLNGSVTGSLRKSRSSEDVIYLKQPLSARPVTKLSRKSDNAVARRFSWVSETGDDMDYVVRESDQQDESWADYTGNSPSSDDDDMVDEAVSENDIVDTSYRRRPSALLPSKHQGKGLQCKCTQVRIDQPAVVKIYADAGLKDVKENGVTVKRSSRQRKPPTDYWRSEVPGNISSKRHTRSSVAPGKVRFLDVIVQRERESTLAKSVRDLEFKDVKDAEYKVATFTVDPVTKKLFSVMLLFPKCTEKPLKVSDGVTMVGFVVSGQIEVTIHKTTLKLGRGESFVVPKGNAYRIVNKSSREAKVYLVNETE
jgi:mannose-6-phosphate isomerase-like protein (cupin superfamily)